MNEAHAKSLELMDDYFSKVTPEEFLKDYLEVETFEGPTVDEVLSACTAQQYTLREKWMDAYSMIIDLVCDDKWSVLTYRLWAGGYLNRKNRKYLQRNLKKALLLGNVLPLPRSANIEHLVDAHNLFVRLERTLVREKFNGRNGNP